MVAEEEKPCKVKIQHICQIYWGAFLSRAKTKNALFLCNNKIFHCVTAAAIHLGAGCLVLVLVPGPGAAVSANFWDASEKNI